MSDIPQGPGWWRASDGLYYPPETRPGDRANGPGGHDGDESPTDPAGHASPERETAPLGDPAPEPDHPTDLGSPATPAPEPEFAPEPEPEFAPEPEPVRRRRRWPVATVIVLLVIAAVAGVGAWVVFVMGDDEDDPTPTDTTEPDTDTDTTEADTTTTTEDTGEVSAFDLRPGNCFDTIEVDEDGGLLVTTVLLTDCDEPHRAEVFSLEQIDDPPGADFPGEEERDRISQELCEPGFVDYVGVSIAESDLVLLWLAPTEDSWVEDDDREIACAIAAPDGEMLVGTVENQGAGSDGTGDDTSVDPDQGAAGEPTGG